MLEHGGQLRRAASQSRISLPEWLDLSTGINPHGWPVPALPPEVWLRLPEAEDGLEAVARDYYGNGNLVPVAGSQAAIQVLPLLFPPATIACLAPIYNEHPAAWKQAGHQVRLLPAGNLERALVAATPRILLCNPNNPTGHIVGREELLAAAAKLGKRGGWLFVDEAFMDSTPEQSVADVAGTPAAPNLVVYRSLGKFFGLAGARVGFLIAQPPLLQALREKIGPWSVSHPARWVASQALADQAWQAAARIRLQGDSGRLLQLLSSLTKSAVPQATPLFVSVVLDDALSLFEFLQARGILVRYFADTRMLRFGLPDSESAWMRLETALQEWCALC